MNHGYLLALLSTNAACAAAAVVVEPVRYEVGATTAVLGAPRVDTTGLDAAITRGHDDAAAIVGAPQFASTVAMIAALLPAADAPALTGTEVVTHLDAEVTVCYRTADRCGTTTASTALGDCNGTPGGVVTLYPATMTRLRGTDAEARACVVNTIVHEWTHAHATPGGGHRFSDDGHGGATAPLVSYTVGAVAQCLYLEHEYTADTAAPFAVDRCVEAIGTTSFDPGTCRAGWGEQFVGARLEGGLW